MANSVQQIASRLTIASQPTCVRVQNRVDGLYIVLISMHGLIRGQHMELGRDADTGGQVIWLLHIRGLDTWQPRTARSTLFAYRQKLPCTPC